MNVVVLYESMTGTTRKAAELIGGAAKMAGCEVSVRSVREPDYHELARADLVIIGTWVDGLIVAGQRPGGAAALKKLPVLQGKQVAIFMTYAINPGKALLKLSRMLQLDGANVVAAAQIKRNRVEAEVGKFVADALDHTLVA